MSKTDYQEKLKIVSEVTYPKKLSANLGDFPKNLAKILVPNRPGKVNTRIKDLQDAGVVLYHNIEQRDGGTSLEPLLTKYYSDGWETVLQTPHGTRYHHIWMPAEEMKDQEQKTVEVQKRIYSERRNCFYYFSDSLELTKVGEQVFGRFEH